MTLGQILGAVWKRKLLFLASFVLFMAAVSAVTFSLPKTYRATATLFVGNTQEVSEALAFDTNIGEQLARTYATLSGNPNVAEEVARRLPFEISRGELLERMAFTPVERTQLLELAAEAESPTEARVIANTYAATFVERVNEQQRRGDAPTRIALSEGAALPTGAVRPDPPLYLGLGGILAAVLAFTLALLRDRLDDRMDVKPEDTEVLGEPVVARIPVLSGRRGGARAEVADAFRLLKTNVDLTAVGRQRVLAVTSPSPAEGKSTICANLAVTAAADGERVALVEADLRRPGLRDTVLGEDGEPPRVGLSNYLVGVADADEVISPHPRIPGLDLVWAGPVPPNAAALLATGRLDELLGHLRSRYDRVIVDTSPISVGADATLILGEVDAVLYAIDAARSKRSAAVTGLTQLRKAHGRLLGVVLNRSDAPGSSSYRYYASGPDAAQAATANAAR